MPARVISTFLTAFYVAPALFSWCLRFGWVREGAKSTEKLPTPIFSVLFVRRTPCGHRVDIRAPFSCQVSVLRQVWTEVNPQRWITEEFKLLT